MKKEEKALEYFDNNYNCAQSVLVAFAPDAGLSEDESLRVACAFGGGIGRQQLTCGALTGAAMTIGLKLGKGKLDGDDKKILSYSKTMELFEEFKKMNGSTDCLKLLEGLNMNDANDHQVIEGRNLYHTHCRKYVSDAVQLTDKLINNNI